MTTAERLAATGLRLGEGPVALDGDDFACVDIRRGLVLRGDLDGRTDVIGRYGETVGAVAPTVDGDLLVARRHSIELLSDPARSVALEGLDGSIRLNDGKADPSGRFVCGTMAEPVRDGAGALYAFEYGRAKALVSNVTISNGLAWAEDAATLFYIDTPTRQIARLRLDHDGDVLERSTEATVPEELGDPDGMAIDADGGLWVALWGGGAVVRFVGGEIVDRCAVDTPFVTSVAFVGRDLDTMVITTAGEPDGAGPAGGDLFVATAPLRGRAPNLIDRERTFG